MDPTESKIIEAEQRLAKMEALLAKGNSPATSNTAGLTEKAAAPVTGRPVFESLDPLKGKALGFAAAARCVALARGNLDAAIHLAKTSAVGFYGEGVLALVKGAFTEHSGTKALGESTLTGGGALLPDPMAAEFIELLRPNVVMQSAPVIHVPMQSLSLTFGRQSGGTTAGWLGEAQALNFSAPTFDNVQLQLKKAGAVVAIANDLLRDNAIAADMVVRQDLVAQVARLIDLGYIRGTGSLYQPRGLLNTVSASNVFNSAAAGTPTLTTALADLWKAIRLVRAANVPFSTSQAFWIFSPRTEAGFAQLRDGVGRPYFATEMANGTLLGYQYFTTTQIPENLSGGGSGGSLESEIYFVVGPQVLIGDGLAPTIQVVPQGAYYDGSAVQSGLSRDETAVSIVCRTDFAMRHPQAAAIVKGSVY